MKRFEKGSPMARLMALAGEQKKQYVRSIILAVIGVAAGCSHTSRSRAW